MSWGTLNPQIYKEGIPVIKDINETTASISIDYQFTSQNENETTEVYDVEEFLQNEIHGIPESGCWIFQRSANQIFDPETAVFSEDGVILGVRNKDVEYLSNDSGTVVAFTQQGDLWSYAPGEQ